MKLITTRTMIRDVAKRWRGSYPKGSTQYGKDKVVIGNKLEALDLESATPEQIAAIIGNDSWTTPDRCMECNSEDGRAVVEIGEPQDYDSHTSWVCRDCLGRALALFGKLGVDL